MSLKTKFPIELIPEQVINICRTLHEDGYQAFIVGGCVRDLILNQSPKDWDITTDASPQKIQSLFEKTIPTGLKHGTITVVMGAGKENHFEVTTFRIESEYKDGRRPEEVFFVMNVEEDLARRDLTINAIAYDPIVFNLMDPFNGLKDLKNGVIKAVGNADSRFQEDGLRIMRAARFAARFNYSINIETFNGMQNNLNTLKKVSKERIKDELCKTLMEKHASIGLQLLQETGALHIACDMINKASFSLFSNVDKCKELETRLALLYNGNPLDQVQKKLIDLKLSNKEIKKVIFLLQLLERFYVFQNKEIVNSYKSFMALVVNHAPDTFENVLEQFIQLTEALGHKSRQLFEKYKNIVIIPRTEMNIDGFDLMEINIVGSEIKKVLEKCYLEILKNPENNSKEFLLDFASQK